MLSLREVQRRAYRAIVLEDNVLPLTRSRAARLEVYRNNARETFRKTREFTALPKWPKVNKNRELRWTT